MKITSLPNHVPPTRLKGAATAAPPPPEATPDQVCGSVGAMAGALLVGRPLVVIGTGVAAAAVAGSLLGPVGAVVGGMAGLYAGVKLELKTKAGRLVGGMVGGALGSAAGKVAGALGYKPSRTMAQECKGFSLQALPQRLLNPHYTSHPKMSAEIAKQGAALAKPGDIIITNDDANFMLEIVQKGVGLVSKGYGADADWTHAYVVGHNNKVLDILIDNDKPSEFPVEHAFTDNCHAMILRPQYNSQGQRDRVLAHMTNQFDKIGYDHKFDMKTDDRQYCQEFVGKALMAQAPQLELRTSSVFGREYLTGDNFYKNPNFQEVYNSGSNFWLNWLSHFH